MKSASHQKFERGSPKLLRTLPVAVGFEQVEECEVVFRRGNDSANAVAPRRVPSSAVPGSGNHRPFRITLLSKDDYTQSVLQEVAESKNWIFQACTKIDHVLLPVSARRPDLMFIDTSSAPAGGAALVCRVKRVLPDIHIIVIAISSDEDAVLRSIVAGASGYLIKPLSSLELALMFQERSKAASIFSPEAASALVDRLHRITLAAC